MNYRSEPARQKAVFLYFLVSYVATLITYASFLAVCAAVGIVTVPVVLALIAAQNISWLVAGTLMCAVLDSLNSPPTPPKEHIKEVSSKTIVTSKRDRTNKNIQAVSGVGGYTCKVDYSPVNYSPLFL